MKLWSFLICVTIAVQQSPGTRLPAAERGASIVGRVVTGDAASYPVRRAIVTLSFEQLEPSRHTITDDAGGFAFTDVPPGEVRVTASKPAYVTTTYGARRPGGVGTPIALAAGQRVDLDVRMARGAAISGVVRSPTGEAIPDTPVVLVPVLPDGSFGPVSTPASAPVLTDDLGRYRVFGLVPGDYVVAATLSANGIGQMVPLSAESVDRAFRQLEAGAPSVLTKSQVPEVAKAHTYVPVYFPGTTDAASAARVSVNAGDDRAGIDFVVDFVTTATVAGTIAWPGPVTTALQVSLAANGPAWPPIRSLSPSVAATPSTDAFKFVGVPPGKYTVVARTAPLSRGQVPSSQGLWGLTEVEVSGDDVTGLRVALQPAMSLTGRLRFDATILKPPDLGTLRVKLTPVRMIGASVVWGEARTFPTTLTGAVRADGTFHMPGAMPGLYDLSIESLRSTWMLRSAVAGGQDLLDSLVEFVTADIADMVVTLSDRRSEVSGVVLDQANQPASDCSVVVFPSDRQLWRSIRRVKTMRPATNGRFRVSPLPAGEYLIAAIKDIEPQQLRNVGLLEQLASTAIRLSVAEGSGHVQDLRIVR